MVQGPLLSLTRYPQAPASLSVGAAKALVSEQNKVIAKQEKPEHPRF